MMFDTSCPSGDDPRLKEYSMLFPNKLNTQEFLFCAMKKYCSVHLSWNTRRSPLIFSASTQPSQTRHARPKRSHFMGENRLIFTSLLKVRQILLTLLTCLGCLRRRTRSITNERSPGCSILRCCHGIAQGQLGVIDDLVSPAEWWTSSWAVPC